MQLIAIQIPYFTGKAVFLRLDEITMKDVDQIIEEAAHNAVHGQRRHKYLRDYAKGIPEEAQDALKDAYHMRHKSFTDPRWSEVYAKFLVAMDDRWDKELGIDKFRTLAFTTKGMKKNIRDNSYDTKGAN